MFPKIYVDCVTGFVKKCTSYMTVIVSLSLGGFVLIKKSHRGVVAVRQFANQRVSFPIIAFEILCVNEPTSMRARRDHCDISFLWWLLL